IRIAAGTRGESQRHRKDTRKPFDRHPSNSREKNPAHAGKEHAIIRRDEAIAYRVGKVFASARVLGNLSGDRTA
ncbi:MAG: hypothetical protein KJ042_06170, partial [Deltaproteobacteria bacterium]|nr:hypothetical protein [Deltaproteobacteria bacterium]